jgi:hypothetical protein
MCGQILVKIPNIQFQENHHLVISPIRIPPRWTQKCQTKRTIQMSIKVELLQDPSIRWLVERRQEIEVSHVWLVNFLLSPRHVIPFPVAFERER